MRAFSLVLVIVQIVAVASANRYYSPISGCQVTVDNYRFDLCPLLSQRNDNSGHLDLVLHHQTPPTITTIVYNISLNGPLRWSDTIYDNEQCTSGSWACLTAYEHQPGPEFGKDDREAEDIPIILGVPQNELDSSVGHKEDLDTYAELRRSVGDSISPLLSLHMHGGYYMNVPQNVQIDFECAESDEDAPKISGIWNNRHILTWATKYACGRVHQTFLEGEQSNSPTEDDETNHSTEDSEEPPPNQDLYTPIPPNRNGPSIRAIIIWSGLTLLGLGYLVVRPPTVLRKRVREIRRARFLRGTRNPKLIHWASEECEMLGVDEYEVDEVDEMVNSRPFPDEEIPLRTGRTRPTLVNYGSAH